MWLYKVSNSSASSNTSTKDPSEEVKKGNSNNLGWEFWELINADDLDKLTCKLYGHNCSGGVYKLKEHLARIRRSVRACSVSKVEDKRSIRL